MRNPTLLLPIFDRYPRLGSRRLPQGNAVCHGPLTTLPLLAITLLAALITGGTASGAPANFETIGLYVWRDTPNQRAFWKACGINTLQFCDTHWSLREDKLDAYYEKFAGEIEAAKKDGFRVYVILFSNIAQWTGPAENEPTGLGVLFDPRDPKALDMRLSSIRRAIKAFRKADGFTFLGGDPGGAIGASFGPLPATEWMRMAEKVRQVVKQEAPHAEFNVNPWAIAYWQYPQHGCDSSEWWLKETELTQTILSDKNLIGPNGGVEIPGHNYYRAMALRNYSRDGITPPLFPTSDDIDRLRAQGAKRLWAWPYFLLDEADDGDVGPDGHLVPGTQIETRYIHRLVNQMRGIGMNGIIGNWSYAGHLAKALNTYAFGRFCNDPKATPEKVIDEYARYVADDVTWPALAQVLRFIESQSNWQRKLPEEKRLPNMYCTLTSPSIALTTLRSVVPRKTSSFALPEPPERYLQRLTERLERLAAQQK